MLGGQIDRMVGRFIRGQLMLVVIMSVATYIGLAGSWAFRTRSSWRRWRASWS